MSFLETVDFTRLSEVDKVIYHYVSRNSEKIPYMRVRDLAAESHTSPSSVMRFVRKFGYESFTDFRKQFQAPAEFASTLDEKFALLTKENFSKNLEAELQKVAQIIFRCENLIFFGMGASGAMCEYAARRFASIGYNSFALTDPTYPIFSKLKNTSDNVVVILSVSGNTAEIIEVANSFYNQADYTTIAITNSLTNALVTSVDHLLDYRIAIKRVHQYEDLTSQLPCIFLLEALSEAVFQLDK